jgi:hypothetical protein
MSMQVSMKSESRKLAALLGPIRSEAKPDPILFDPSLLSFHPPREVFEDNLGGLERKLDKVLPIPHEPEEPQELQTLAYPPAINEEAPQDSGGSEEESPLISRTPIDVHVVNDQIVDLKFDEPPDAIRVTRTYEFFINLGFFEAKWSTLMLDVVGAYASGPPLVVSLHLF